MCKVTRDNENKKSDMEMGVGLSKGKGVVEGASGHCLPHLSIDHAMRSERNTNKDSQHTEEFTITGRFSWAVEFIIDLGALGKISVALAQSRAHTLLRISRYTDVLFQ
jgi:hypothetical protein